MSKPITEGLKRHDLDHMILPMISIDEFASKIDDKTVIVVAFYCMEEDPAHDLSNFIERSPTNPLDTDVSPAPSKEGYYVTFVELKRGARFVSQLLKIIDEISNLTDITEWQFTSVNMPKGKVLPLTAENLNTHVNLKVKSDTHAQLKEFLHHSSLTDYQLQEHVIQFERYSQQVRYQFVSVTSHAPSGVMQLQEHVVSELRQLERMLDGPYEAHMINSELVIHNQIQDTYLILRDWN